MWTKNHQFGLAEIKTGKSVAKNESKTYFIIKLHNYLCITVMLSVISWFSNYSLESPYQDENNGSQQNVKIWYFNCTT